MIELYQPLRMCRAKVISFNKCLIFFQEKYFPVSSFDLTMFFPESAFLKPMEISS